MGTGSVSPRSISELLALKVDVFCYRWHRYEPRGAACHVDGADRLHVRRSGRIEARGKPVSSWRQYHRYVTFGRRL